jgi:hypothetical protein
MCAFKRRISLASLKKLRGGTLSPRLFHFAENLVETGLSLRHKSSTYGKEVINPKSQQAVSEARRPGGHLTFLKEFTRKKRILSESIV